MIGVVVVMAVVFVLIGLALYGGKDGATHGNGGGWGTGGGGDG